MNIKQIEWILRKALLLIETYKGRILTDREYSEMAQYVKNTVEESHGNTYCRKILIDVLECFDREAKRNKGR